MLLEFIVNKRETGEEEEEEEEYIRAWDCAWNFYYYTVYYRSEAR